MELFSLILDNVNNNGKYDPKKFIGFSYLNADGHETLTDRICTFYQNDNGEINVLYARIDSNTKKLVNYDDEDDIKSPDMSSPKYRLDYEQLEYFKTNMPFYIGEDKCCSDPARLNNFCELINDREKQCKWINEQLNNIRLSDYEKEECMKVFLKFNRLLIKEDIREEHGELTYSELKHLVDTEIDTKLFSASHRRSNKNYSEIVITKSGEGGLNSNTAGRTLPKRLKGDENKILLNTERIGEYKKNTVLDKTKTVDYDTVKHEIGHFKLGMIEDEIREKIANNYEGYEKLDEIFKAGFTRFVSAYMNNKLKKYIRESSLQRYNEAAELVGLSNAKKGKTYNKYDGVNEVSKKLLMGHSAYSRFSSEEYLAETESTDNYDNAILNELFVESFDNDFSKLDQKNLDRFLGKIGINNNFNKKEVMAIVNRWNKLNSFLNPKKVDDESELEEKQAERSSLNPKKVDDKSELEEKQAERSSLNPKKVDDKSKLEEKQAERSSLNPKKADDKSKLEEKQAERSSLNPKKADYERGYTSNLAKKVTIDGRLVNKLTEDNSDEAEGIKKIVKYAIILRALENVAAEVDSIRDDKGCKEKFKNNLDSEFKEFDFKKINTTYKFTNIDIEQIKKEVRTSINNTKGRIEKLSDLKAGLEVFKKECIVERQPVGPDRFNQIFNYDEHYDENENYKDQRFVLMNKFKSKKPYFNNLVKKLKSKTESNETIKKILKEELHDIQDAYLFYSLLGKKLDDFVNPFNMEISTKKNFVDETRDKFNRMIDTIDWDSNDLEKASKIENKNFYELFSEYKKINQNVNQNQNVSTLTSRLEIEKAKLRINNKNDKVSSLNKSSKEEDEKSENIITIRKNRKKVDISSNKSSKEEDEKSENIITIRKNRKKVDINSNKSSKQEDAKQENINTIKTYKKNADTSSKIPNEREGEQSKKIITIRKSKKKINMSSNGNVEAEKQSHGDKSEKQEKLNITTLKNAVRKKYNDRKINQVVVNGVENKNNDNVDNSNRQDGSANNVQMQFNNFELLNLIRIYKLLDVALENIALPDNAKPQIIIPTGPMYVIGQDTKLGFPNIIMKVGENDAYYLSNKGVISKDTIWRPLNNDFDKLLEDKISRNDERRSERAKDRGKLESRDGVGIISLNTREEIQKFKADLKNMINIQKQAFEQLAQTNNREFIEGNNHIREKEEEFNSTEPNRILTKLREGIDYKFKIENYKNENASKKPFISFERMRDLIKYSEFFNKNNRQEESRSVIKINEISNNNRRKNENVSMKNHTTLKRLGIRAEKNSGCCCLK